MRTMSTGSMFLATRMLPVLATIAACAAPATAVRTQPAAAAAPAVGFGPTPLRMLTRLEYDNTVRDLLGDTSRPARAFPREPDARGAFDSDVAAARMAPLQIEQVVDAAESLARDAAARWSTQPSCPPQIATTDACARRFVESFGVRAFRRPLQPDESAAFLRAYDQGARDGGGFGGAVERVVRLALQSPQFLYQVEVGTPVAPGVARLDGWEMASRLSYFLWRTMPDDTLFRAAAAGDLATAAGVRAHAARMLASPRARPVVVDFHAQWLRLGRVGELDKDREVLGREFDRRLRGSMAGEMAAFVEHVVFGERGDLATLLAAPYTFVDARLAPLYQVPAPGGPGFAKVALDPARRAGLLTQVGLLAVHATPSRSAPIARGLLVREQILCEPIGDPPPGSAAKLPRDTPAATTRARFAQHAEDPFCAGCHDDIDPLGFLFENYDAVGRWRAQERGHPVDATATFDEAPLAGTFRGAAELARRLAASDQVRTCYVRQWLRYAFGREMTRADAPTVAALRDRFARDGGRIQDLLLDIVSSEAFRHRIDGEVSR